MGFTKHLAIPALIVAAAAMDRTVTMAAEGSSHSITNSVGMKLVLIPAGSFTMGSPTNEAERDAKEIQHEVSITRPFYMGAYEVTQADFLKVMPSDSRISAAFEGSDRPMESVAWEDAVKFCEALSALPDEQQAVRKYRLPTEAEWEYACRAGTTTPFHFGESLSSRQANFNGRYPYGGAPIGPYLRQTAKVGSYEPNRFGLYDMHGNVAEWCSDWYDPVYYENSPEEDPLGPPFGVVSDGFDQYYSVIRGGSWLDEARGCRSAFRYRAMRRTPNRLVGFRVVCEWSDEQQKR
jgi:formylglycine-generating enzyme required for sulfatase activity